jgi:hypothetical protein
LDCSMPNTRYPPAVFATALTDDSAYLSTAHMASLHSILLQSID